MALDRVETKDKEQKNLGDAKVAPKVARPVGLRKLVVRGIFFCFVLAAALIQPPAPYVRWAVISAAVWASVFYVLLAGGGAMRNDDDYRIKCKRILALVTGAACGLPGVIGYLKGEQWWIEVGGGIQFGCYWADMMLITDSQARIDALIFHHFFTIGFNLWLVFMGAAMHWTFIAVALFMEVTNPFWYLNIVANLHTNVGENVLWWTKHMAMYSYIIVRFCFVTPQVVELTAHTWFLRLPTMEGFTHIFILVAFTRINIDNLVKLVRSEPRRR